MPIADIPWTIGKNGAQVGIKKYGYLIGSTFFFGT
jgi:hypothetical protein